VATGNTLGYTSGLGELLIIGCELDYIPGSNVNCPILEEMNFTVYNL